MSVASPKMEIHRRPKALTDVRAKLRRAAQHISEVKAYISSKQGPQRITETVQSKPSEPGVAAQFALPTPIDNDLPMIVGEAIQDLRQVLDYLVYDLAWVDSGQVPQDEEHTQFPIVEKPASFAKAAKTALKGLNSQHRVKIESLQTYKGCQWTPLLARYSNRDKHRHPVAVTWSGHCPVETEIILRHEPQVGEGPSTDARRIETNLKLDASMTHAGVGDYAEFRLPVQDGRGHALTCCSAESIDLRFRFEGEYHLPDGRPVLDTLLMLQDEVGKLVDALETELRAAGII